jgi:hypothetical protein
LQGGMSDADLAVAVWQAFGAVAIILAIFVPVAIRLYRRTT